MVQLVILVIYEAHTKLSEHHTTVLGWHQREIKPFLIHCFVHIFIYVFISFIQEIFF